mmetsp:Transcript_19690/g.47771  ORF Transcript_19690/g.47771 Transcript_19690/m.47771 type:complete len:257 (-) Transcript_19690:75-845(-)
MHRTGQDIGRAAAVSRHTLARLAHRAGHPLRSPRATNPNVRARSFRGPGQPIRGATIGCHKPRVCVLTHARHAVWCAAISVTAGRSTTADRNFSQRRCLWAALGRPSNRLVQLLGNAVDTLLRRNTDLRRRRTIRANCAIAVLISGVHEHVGTDLFQILLHSRVVRLDTLLQQLLCFLKIYTNFRRFNLEGHVFRQQLFLPSLPFFLALRSERKHQLATLELNLCSLELGLKIFIAPTQGTMLLPLSRTSDAAPRL